ncbi:NAD(P)H-binding protein [Dyadobacter fanqingshengii]|uniref:NAD(P)H-binding protein n=1 Tax=Dyadobacter fanqingshengii TaxID=2906443 RepID=A0A9X1PA88_9BACT|nr:NAD(P)H-binding protein [Dyadobacter fanqingshengii]MCF0040870.1 NAD(P)H-binding protein [Dyadobacter fanqingshengii]USJ37398.1 NAD(P)H-binding protein [Dyadobacter fanqingshengii]
MKTLVLGGTGKTGRKVAERLQKLNADVRIGSRSASPAFDWEDKSTWDAALDGIDQVYISFQPDLAAPGATAAISALAKSAADAGVKKLVLLSGRGEEEAQQCEQIVMSSGLDWTIVRASFFNQNFSESFLVDSVAAGYVVLPVGDMREPFIDTDDIADVAVAALTDTKHSRKVYEVTGPLLLTFGEAVQEIAEATNREIVYQEVTIGEYEAMLTKYHVPTDVISLLKYLFTEVMDGRNEYLSNGVEEALGRKPTDFKEFVQKTIGTGVWNQSVYK